jgi:uncharacterized protein YprB with RNaseH-like and TPR domain
MRDLTALRERLRRAGLQPASSLGPPPPKIRSIPEDWPGQPVTSPLGEYFLGELFYPCDYSHGSRSISDGPGVSPLPAAFDLAAEIAPARMVFMDTETTGLAGGTGTLAFLVGMGSYMEGGFRLRQYFLADPAGEAALLEDALAEMEAGSALVTYNGRAFDVPILQARAALRLRRFDALAGFPHLDLLPHARRLWKRRLESCSLGSIERAVLGVRRSREDVPGSLIPTLYREYLQSGDSRPLSGVMYHNAQDILSLAVLAADIVERHGKSPAEAEDPLEALAFASIYRNRGQLDRAGECYRAALHGGLPAGEKICGLDGLAALLKRGRKYDEAVTCWEEWHAIDPSDPRPCEELAKYYEWRAGDFDAAIEWAEREAADGDDAGRRGESRREIERRLARLRKKRGIR